jgi:iron(III) transport system substrate-binding protein
MNPLRLVFFLSVVATAGCKGSQPRVVLYCAQDREFAEGILGEFTRQTGLAVAPKYDTEADKSVSLYFEIVHEKDRPRCDVFWNNEILSTIRLQKQGLLETYASEPGKLYLRAADDTWHAFASRARVLIVNTQLVAEGERPRSLFELTEPRWKDRVTMARPQFGTSATQAACLFQVLGKEKAETFYRGLEANGVQISPGNKQAAEWVGQGRTAGGQPVAVGITDTDDAMEEVRAGRPVAIVFPDQEGTGTLYIPNSIGIVKGSPNHEGARQLVDYLLNGDVENALEKAGWHFPMRRGHDETRAPAPELQGGKRHMEVDFEAAAELWDEVQQFLRREFARP